MNVFIRMLQQYQNESLHYIEICNHLLSLLARIERFYPHIFKECVTKEEIEKVKLYEEPIKGSK